MKTKNQNSEDLVLHLGDNLKSLATYKENSIHAVIIDGPYGLNSKEYDVQELVNHYQKGQSYMLGGKGIVGMDWDSHLPTLALCKELLRVLKPGGYVACFAGSRTYDILVFTMRWAGFLIKDQMIWTYASGVPKGEWLSRKERDPKVIASKKLVGLNTCLKPAIEPIVLAQKPLAKGETVRSNVKKYGTGALNIGAVMVTRKDGEKRYPANIITDGSKVVQAGFTDGNENFNSCPANYLDELLNPILYYSKAQLRDKEFGLDKHNATKSRKALFSGTDLSIKNIHPTVKPIALMRHLVRLLSKPGDIVLDCFLGSGSTGISAILEGRKFIGMEINKDYFDVATARIERTQNLIKKFKVTDPEQLMVLAELDSLNEKLDEIAKLVLKNPGNRVHQEKLEKLSKLKELRCKDLLKIKKAA